MDAGVVHEVDDGLVALLVLVAQVLSQVDEQLSAHSLVAVHVGDVLKLRLTCGEQTRAVILHNVFDLRLCSAFMAQSERLNAKHNSPQNHREEYHSDVTIFARGKQS